MTGVRGDHATPGELRRSQNWIGLPGSTLAQASYVPPPHEEMLDHLGAWEKFLHDEMLPPLVQTALCIINSRRFTHFWTEMGGSDVFSSPCC